MAHISSCADNLVLLGEMLQTASQDIGLCDEVLEDEHGFMIDLATSQIVPLQHSCTILSEDLGNWKSEPSSNFPKAQTGFDQAMQGPQRRDSRHNSSCSHCSVESRFYEKLRKLPLDNSMRVGGLGD